MNKRIITLLLNKDICLNRNECIKTFYDFNYQSDMKRKSTLPKSKSFVSNEIYSFDYFDIRV